MKQNVKNTNETKCVQRKLMHVTDGDDSCEMF